MKIKFSNNASTKLFSSVTPSDTQIVVSPGGGALFPQLVSGEFFMITVTDVDGNLEIMGVIARSTDTFTVTRAQENTPARSFPEGATVELRLTAGSIGEMATQIYNDSLSYTDSKVLTAIPRGIITMWSGAVNAVPSGWLLCDGNNGTPNLKDRFIVGAGGSYGVGATGGSVTQTPNVWTNAAGTGVWVNGHAITIDQMPGHQHAGSVYAARAKSVGLSSDQWKVGIAENQDIAFTTSITGGSQPHSHTIGDNSHAHGAGASAIDVRPPYYALAYIMKA